jgi:hypothetical protein
LPQPPDSQFSATDAKTTQEIPRSFGRGATTTTSRLLWILKYRAGSIRTRKPLISSDWNEGLLPCTVAIHRKSRARPSTRLQVRAPFQGIPKPWESWVSNEQSAIHTSRTNFEGGNGSLRIIRWDAQPGHIELAEPNQRDAVDQIARWQESRPAVNRQKYLVPDRRRTYVWSNV